MKQILPLAVSIAFVLAAPAVRAQAPAPAQTDYQLTEDSKPHDNVPKGEVTKYTFADSKIFPGTTREYWVYVPKQYDPAKPACLYVSQDGVQANAPVVFDNLIAKGEMPVTIGVFIMHGKVLPPNDNAIPRFNRSFEYDGLGPNYVNFLLDELLPDVEKKTASDGRKIVISKKAADRCIGGESSGAVCAFTAAWERPDAFSRVYSCIGTYVGLRGANEYPTLLRKYEPKAIRVFQQDGSNDLNIYAGDWWMVNQEMERALTFAGYEHDHIWGDNGHNGKHSAAIFPDAMRFLWKGWPEAVKTGTTKNKMVTDIFTAEEKWQEVPGAAAGTEALSVNAKGEIAFSPTRKSESGALKSGNNYVAGPGKSAGTEKGNPDGVRLVTPDGKSTEVDSGPIFASGITASPDQSLLYVADGNSHWVWSYQIQPDGKLAYKQRYNWLHVPDTADDAGAGGMCVDTEGRLYVATRLGVQICDQPGRVNCIIPVPGGEVKSVALGGPGLNTLYAVSGGKVYQRKVKSTGVISSADPIKPKIPGL
jgi:enterochelin esterase-like enzyme